MFKLLVLILLALNLLYRIYFDDSGPRARPTRFNIQQVMPTRDALTDEFALYIGEFERQQMRTVNINIRFAALPVGIVGYCYTASRLIEIDLKSWHDMGEEQRLQVVLHELGHCILDRRHIDTKDVLPIIVDDVEVYCPTSIMYPSVSSWLAIEHCFNKKRQYYLTELFQ